MSHSKYKFTIVAAPALLLFGWALAAQADVTQTLDSVDAIPGVPAGVAA